MRGSTKLFSDIFQPKPVPGPTKKGRSDKCILTRNECLIDRYYHYCLQQLSYTVVLERIAAEFFLSINTIPYIIAANATQLKNLRDEKPSLQYFKKKWPHLAW